MKKIIKKLLKKLINKYLENVIQDVLIEYRNEIRIANSTKGESHLNVNTQLSFNQINDLEFIRKYINNL